jgi:hypothetical protein
MTETRRLHSGEDGGSLPEYLSARARASSDARLALDAIVGLLCVVAFSLWRVPGWYLLVGIGACFLSYGTWAIANRELADLSEESRLKTRLLRALSALSAAAGFAAVAFLMLAVLAKLIGPIIS